MTLASLAALARLTPLAALAGTALASLTLAALAGLAAVGLTAVVGGTVFQSINGGPDVSHINRQNLTCKGPRFQMVGLFQSVHPFHAGGNGNQVRL